MSFGRTRVLDDVLKAFERPDILLRNLHRDMAIMEGEQHREDRRERRSENAADPTANVRINTCEEQKRHVTDGDANPTTSPRLRRGLPELEVRQPRLQPVGGSMRRWRRFPVVGASSCTRNRSAKSSSSVSLPNSSRWRPVNRFAFQRPDLQGDVLPISPSLAHRYFLKVACVSIRDYFQNLDAKVAERHRDRAAACLPLRILSSPGHAPALRIRFRMPDAVGDPDADERRDSLFVPHQRSIIIRIQPFIRIIEGL